MSTKKKVFLGGTCNGSFWRGALIPHLLINFFNPVVDDWNEAAAAQEIKEREECDFCLYVITPRMTGVYSIAEVTEDAIKRPEKTIFCYLEKDDFGGQGPMDFSPVQMKSLKAVGNMVQANGAQWFTSLEEVANYLNA